MNEWERGKYWREGGNMQVSGKSRSHVWTHQSSGRKESVVTVTVMFMLVCSLAFATAASKTLCAHVRRWCTSWEDLEEWNGRYCNPSGIEKSRLHIQGKNFDRCDSNQLLQRANITDPTHETCLDNFHITLSRLKLNLLFKESQQTLCTVRFKQTQYVELPLWWAPGRSPCSCPCHGRSLQGACPTLQR